MYIALLPHFLLLPHFYFSFHRTSKLVMKTVCVFIYLWLVPSSGHHLWNSFEFRIFISLAKVVMKILITFTTCLSFISWKQPTPLCRLWRLSCSGNKFQGPCVNTLGVEWIVVLWFSTWEMTDRFQESSSAIPWGNTKRLQICPALDTGQTGFILNSSGALSKNTGGPGHHLPFIARDKQTQ